MTVMRRGGLDIASDEKEAVIVAQYHAKVRNAAITEKRLATMAANKKAKITLPKLKCLED